MSPAVAIARRDSFGVAGWKLGRHHVSQQLRWPPGCVV